MKLQELSEEQWQSILSESEQISKENMKEYFD